MQLQRDLAVSPYPCAKPRVSLSELGGVVPAIPSEIHAHLTMTRVVFMRLELYPLVWVEKPPSVINVRPFSFIWTTRGEDERHNRYIFPVQHSSDRQGIKVDKNISKGKVIVPKTQTREFWRSVISAEDGIQIPISICEIGSGLGLVIESYASIFLWNDI
jgi:hypothetical protein